MGIRVSDKLTIATIAKELDSTCKGYPKIRKSGGKRFQRQTEGNFLTGHKLKPLFLRTTWKTDPPRLLKTYDLKMLVMENDKKTSLLNLTWNGKKRCLQNIFRKNGQLIFCAETFLEI